MQNENFIDLVGASALYRLYRAASLSRLAWILVIVVTVGGCIEVLDGFTPRSRWILVFLVMGELIAVYSARYFGYRMGRLMSAIDGAFVDNAAADTLLSRYLQSNPPGWKLGCLIGLCCGSIVYRMMWKEFHHWSRAYAGVIIIVGGIVLGVGTVKYIWDYRLIWKIAANPISVWHAHVVQKLAAYNYLLTLIGLVPIFYSFYSWAKFRKGGYLAVGIMIVAILVWTFVWTEARLRSMVGRSRDAALAAVIAEQKRLWAGSSDLPSDQQAIETLAALSSIRDSLVHVEPTGVIAWNDFLTKVVIPIIAGSIAVVIELLKRPS